MGSFNRLSYYDAFKKRDLLYELEEKDEIAVKKITVNDMFEKYYQLKSNSWSEHTRLRKRQIYEYDIQPILGKMEVKQVKIHHILKVTERIEKRDALHTLEKVVTIIKNIFLKAYQLNHISHNPALALEDLVMKPVRQNYPALIDSEDLSNLVKRMDNYRGNYITIQALQFLLLTTQRSYTVRAAKWENIDFENCIWDIPAEDMKMKTPLRLPLSKQAIEILEDIRQYTGGEKYIFKSFRSKSGILSENTFNIALKRMGFSSEDTVAHGFRTSFMTSMAEMGFPVDVLNLILDHRKRNKIEAAYNRSEKFEDKKIILQAWADYLDKLRTAKNPSTVKVKVAKASIESYIITDRAS